MTHKAHMSQRVEAAFPSPSSVHRRSGPVANLAPLRDGAAVGTEAYLAHPAPSDAALHLGAVMSHRKGPTMVPVGLSCMRIPSKVAAVALKRPDWAITGGLNYSLFSYAHAVCGTKQAFLKLI